LGAVASSGHVNDRAITSQRPTSRELGDRVIDLVDPSDPVITTTTVRAASTGGTIRSRAAAIESGARSTAAMLSRSGVPVTIALGSLEGKAQQRAHANRVNSRWAAPGSASSSTSTRGRRHTTAAKHVATEA